MKISAIARLSIALFLAVSMFAPTLTLAATNKDDAKKHFLEGMR